MKKGLLTILTLALIGILSLTGCNTAPSNNTSSSTTNANSNQGSTINNVSSSDPVEISFMHIHGGAGGELINEFCKEFTEKSGGQITVKPIYVEGSYEGIIEKLQMLGLSNNLPDISQAGHQYAYYMSENMPIVPLQKFIDKESYDTSDIFPKMLDLGKDASGQIVGLPFAVSTPVLYYNKEMFEANGITEPPKTFDELREVAKKLTKDDQFGIYINYEITGNWEVQALIENFGGQMLTQDRSAVAFEDAGLKTFSLINTLTNVDKSMPVTDGSEGATQASEMFKAGKIGMYITTIAGLRGYQKDAQFTVMTAPHPSVDSSTHAAPAGGNSVYILTQDEAKQQAAWEFIKYISAPEQTSRVAQVFGYMSTSQKSITAPELMGDYLKENPAAFVTYDQVKYMTPWTNFPGSSGTKYVKITQDNLSAMIHQEKTPEQALQDTVDKLNDIIKQG